jgi:ribosomal protein L32
MGVPKRRVSSTRKRERRSHHALTVPTLEACPNCGWYGGREAVRIREKKSADQG